MRGILRTRISWRAISADAEHDAALLVLTAVSGVVDAFAFLALGRVFTANMTGNLVLFAIAAGQGAGAAALRSIVAKRGRRFATRE
jgi:uncharacterized membrane protein YoaK (UPF0700 family)